MKAIISPKEYQEAIEAKTQENANRQFSQLVSKVCAHGVPVNEAENFVRRGLEGFARYCFVQDYERTVVLYNLSVSHHAEQATKEKLLTELETGNYSQELLNTDVSLLSLWQKEAEGAEVPTQDISGPIAIH